MTLYLFVNGMSWTVERRYETVPSVLSRRHDEPKLFLFFSAGSGEVRRNQIPEDFPEDPAPRLLESVWRTAEVLRPGALGEMRSRGQLVVPTLRDTIREFSRAILLRCPNCGARNVLQSWFKLRDRCPVCGLRLERGEDEDYFLGGMMFNIILAEVVFVIAFTILLVLLWPNVPWDTVEYCLVVAMIAAPIVLYPVSKLLWLALDLLLRPPDAAEMAWHASDKRD